MRATTAAGKMWVEMNWRVQADACSSGDLVWQQLFPQDAGTAGVEEHSSLYVKSYVLETDMSKKSWQGSIRENEAEVRKGHCNSWAEHREGFEMGRVEWWEASRWGKMAQSSSEPEKMRDRSPEGTEGKMGGLCVSKAYGAQGSKCWEIVIGLSFI